MNSKFDEMSLALFVPSSRSLDKDLPTVLDPKIAQRSRVIIEEFWHNCALNLVEQPLRRLIHFEEPLAKNLQVRNCQRGWDLLGHL